MLHPKRNDTYDEMRAKLDALDRSHGVIEFDMDGTILTANARFLSAVGYTLPEIQGQHRSFLNPLMEESGPVCAGLWAAMRRGEFCSAECRCCGKDGREVWIQATYNPLRDSSGAVYKVVELCTDVTALRCRTDEIEQAIAHTAREIFGTACAVKAAFAKAEAAADAARELVASVRDIGRRAAEASESTRHAAALGRQTSDIVCGLATSTDRIGSAVNLISIIATQTNLLALNATVEAACAGEAGKEVAVIACEMKMLASQTARATTEIATQVSTVQAGTVDAIAAVQRMAAVIEEMSEDACDLALAVAAQESATQEILTGMATASERMRAAAEETAQIASTIERARMSRGTAVDAPFAPETAAPAFTSRRGMPRAR